MEKIAFYVVLFAVFGVIAAVVGYYSSRAEKKRSEALGPVADALGFTFDQDPDDETVEQCAHFWLFGHGHSKKAWNRMRGTTADLDVTLFDYQYVTGAGKNRQTHTQTIVRFRLAGHRLPTFTLRPESFWHKVGALFGNDDIDFETHPKFSKLYLLHGTNEDRVRAAFTDAVLEYFEDTPGLCVEAAGEELLFYRQASRPKPEADDIKQLLADGFEVYGLFREVAVPAENAPVVEDDQEQTETD
jgi:hypothetical protein